MSLGNRQPFLLPAPSLTSPQRKHARFFGSNATVQAFSISFPRKCYSITAPHWSNNIRFDGLKTLHSLTCSHSRANSEALCSRPSCAYQLNTTKKHVTHNNNTTTNKKQVEAVIEAERPDAVREKSALGKNTANEKNSSFTHKKSKARSFNLQKFFMLGP